MKILFVCKYNRFRSKVAEAIYNSLNQKESSFAESAGIQLDTIRPYVEKNVVLVLKEKGYDVEDGSRRIQNVDLNDFDKIVIVADNVSEEEFKDYNGEILKWDIGDCDANEIDLIKKITDEIEGKIKFELL